MNVNISKQTLERALDSASFPVVAAYWFILQEIFQY